MGKQNTELNDLGKSRLLAKRHWKWLDGKYDGTRADRKMKSEIQNRIADGLKEIRFIKERMDPEQLEDVGLSSVRPNVKMSHSEVDNGFPQDFQDAGFALAQMGGMGEDLEDLVSLWDEEDIEHPADPAAIALSLEYAWKEAGHKEEEFPEKWEEFKTKIRMELFS